MPIPPTLDNLWPKGFKGARRYKAYLVRQLSDVDLRELVRRIGGRIAGCNGGTRTVAANQGSAESRNKTRIIHKIRRRLLGKDLPPRPVRLSKSALTSKLRECKVMQALVPDRLNRWLPVVRRKNAISIDVTNFSFVDYPEETIQTLRKIAMAEASARTLIINFIDEVCLDITPYLVLGLMRPNMAPVIVGGRITATVGAMVSAVDLDSFLNMAVHRPNEKNPSFLPFRVRYRRSTGKSTAKEIAFQPSTAEKLTDDLNDTIDRWLRFRRKSGLSNEGKSYVARMVTEVLDNAERHSDIAGQDGDWVIAGFMSAVRREPEGQVSYFCSIGVASIGASIAESLATCEDPRTNNLIQDYIRRHSDAGRYPEDLLRTVYALQDRISRFRQDDPRSKGGVGLMDLIQFVDDIGASEPVNERPRITLLSGRSCIEIRHPYGYHPPVPKTSRRLWFNPENTVEQPPDPHYVKSLPYEFPGTVVAIRFCINAEFITEVAVSNENAQAGD